jgi:hypothetical protein
VGSALLAPFDVIYWVPDAPGFGAQGQQDLHCAAPAETGDVFEAVKNP